MFDTQMLEPLLAMMPPAMAAALRAIGTSIPELGERVMAGEIDPAEAGRLLGEEMIPTFEAMAKEAGVASEATEAV